MEEDISIINSNTRNEKVRNFFVNNKNKIISTVVVLIVILIGAYSYDSYKTNKKKEVSNKFNSTILTYSKNTKDIRDKAILIGIEFFSNGSSPLGNNLKELNGLAETAHYNVISIISQKLTRINAKSFIGKGKVEEVAQLVRLFSADIVIFDENLSPAQNRNLENVFKCRVIDRSWLILEIFGNHARTREAKAQVELASLKYALPRLTKMWGHLSRQRGGIGMKDVGETQIQLDQRMIRNEIHKLEKKLKQIDSKKFKYP